MAKTFAIVLGLFVQRAVAMPFSKKVALEHGNMKNYRQTISEAVDKSAGLLIDAFSTPSDEIARTIEIRTNRRVEEHEDELLRLERLIEVVVGSSASQPSGYARALIDNGGTWWSEHADDFDGLSVSDRRRLLIDLRLVAHDVGIFMQTCAVERRWQWIWSEFVLNEWGARAVASKRVDFLVGGARPGGKAWASAIDLKTTGSSNYDTSVHRRQLRTWKPLLSRASFPGDGEDSYAIMFANTKRRRTPSLISVNI